VPTVFGLRSPAVAEAVNCLGSSLLRLSVGGRATTSRNALWKTQQISHGDLNDSGNFNLQDRMLFLSTQDTTNMPHKTKVAQWLGRGGFEKTTSGWAFTRSGPLS